MSLLEERVREKQLEVKIICFKNLNGSLVKSWYSVTFNRIDLNFLATSLLIKSRETSLALRTALGGIGARMLFSWVAHL